MPGFWKLQVRSNCLLEYYQVENLSQYAKRLNSININQLRGLQSKKYTGTIKQGTKRRMTRAIELLCQIATTRRLYSKTAKRMINHRLSFITLTISQAENITARAAYDSCLGPFLKYLRDSCQCNTYIWKAEIQKRGQIHYHITTPSYIHYKALRDKWNYLQRKAGFLDSYFQTHGHYDANSTDVHGVHHVKNLPNYLLKEFKKTYQNPETTGKVWDCSLNLKAYSYFTFEDLTGVSILIHNMQQEGLIEVIDCEQCRIIKFPVQGLIELLPLDAIAKYDRFKQDVANYKRESKVP